VVIGVNDNAEYTDPESFIPLMDIFSTQSLASARVILSQLEAIHTSVYSEYTPAILNASQSAINETLATGYSTVSGYLGANLAAYNTMAPLGITTSAKDGLGTQTGGGGKGSSKTTLAMWRVTAPCMGLITHG